MLDSDKKQVAKPISCDTYTLIHTNQGLLLAFLNNLRKLHKIRQYNDNLSNINISDTGVLEDRKDCSSSLSDTLLESSHELFQLVHYFTVHSVHKSLEGFRAQVLLQSRETLHGEGRQTHSVHRIRAL